MENFLQNTILQTLIVMQIALIGAIVVYYFRLARSAQDAAMHALPKRRWLATTENGRKFLAKFIRADAANEHISGMIDLEKFRVYQIITSPVVRGNFLVNSAKRMIDLCVSIGLAIFVSPVLICTAIAIKLESKGPVFYTQCRVGREGKTFNVIKFRSMTTDAEKNGAVWAAEKDNRVTTVGAFIRKTRIDEIPQVINVLRGDMSFVGPRPERPEFTGELAETIVHYDERHRIKPGLTGWAQVNYPYGASIDDAREKLKYDLYYIKNFSLLLDLFIIVRTLRVAVKGVGAR